MKFKYLKEVRIEDFSNPNLMSDYTNLLNEIKETYDETKTSEMYTFGELLTKCDLTILRSWFVRMLIKEELVKNHMDVYDYTLNKYKNENRTVTVNKDNMLLYVISYVDVDNVSVDDEYPYDVSGIKLTNKEDFETFALEFRPWDEWLNFYVLKENIEDFSIEEFVAAAIYEMTYAGFETLEETSPKDTSPKDTSSNYEKVNVNDIVSGWYYIVDCIGNVRVNFVNVNRMVDADYTPRVDELAKEGFSFFRIPDLVIE